MQKRYGNRSLKEVLQTKEYERIRQLMPTRFSSLDDLPTAKELADLSDEELFQKADTFKAPEWIGRLQNFKKDIE